MSLTGLKLINVGIASQREDTVLSVADASAAFVEFMRGFSHCSTCGMEDVHSIIANDPIVNMVRLPSCVPTVLTFSALYFRMWGMLCCTLSRMEGNLCLVAHRKQIEYGFWVSLGFVVHPIQLGMLWPRLGEAPANQALETVKAKRRRPSDLTRTLKKNSKMLCALLV